MASPVDAAQQGTNISTAATSHAINVGSPVAGTLLIVFVRFAAAPGTVTFTGYTLLVSDTSDASDDQTEVYYRWADGSEGATDTLTTVNSVKAAAICWEVTGAENPSITPPLASTVTVLPSTATSIRANGAPQADIDITHTAGPTVFTVSGSPGSDTAMAQSFIAVATSITSVGVVVASSGSPTDNLRFQLRADFGGEPSSTPLATVGTVSGSSLPTSIGGRAISIDCSPITVSIGVTYWIVFERTGSRDTANDYSLYGSTSSGYTDGRKMALDSGIWGGVTNADMGFKVASGTSRDYLHLTVLGLDGETQTATAPSGFANTTSANSGTAASAASNCIIWGASKQVTAVSEDAGQWTHSAPNAGVTAFTIAIPAPAPPSDSAALAPWITTL